MIGLETNRIVYKGDGITKEFPFTFTVQEKTDMVVTLVHEDGTNEILTKDYFVDLDKKTVNYPGYAPGEEPAEAERPETLPVGAYLVLHRDIPITQETYLGDKWPWNVNEDELDKITMILQDLKSESDRHLTLSPEAEGVNVTLPSPKANMGFYWDETGTKLVEGLNPKAATEQAAASAAAASTSASAASVSEVNAKSSEEAAAESAKEASTYLDIVKANADAAKKSENAAKASETNAAASETAAKASEEAAKVSENEAGISEANAEESAAAAKTSEENAASAATAAATSAANAEASKMAASTSETNAAESAAQAEAEAEKLKNTLNYKGSVATYSELPENPENGDMWSVQAEDTTHGIAAGGNVIWNGTAWNVLSGDMSLYAKTADEQGDVTNVTATDATITITKKSGATSTATINNVASATKASQDASGNIITSTYAKVTDLATVATSGDFNDLSNNTINDILPKTAASHNSIYRGKDLTSYFNSGGMSTAIAAGTFDDIFPGDYITKSVTVNGTTYSNVKWLVADLDYHLHRGDAETTAHHVVMIPENNLGTSYMNSTNTTAGGYQGSYMWKTTIPLYVTGIVNAFGSTHVLEHDEILTNAMNANNASSAGMGWTGSAYWDWNGTPTPWQTVKVNIPNQAMMYGNHPLASSGREEGDCNKQLAIFRYGQNFTRVKWCWLRDVATSSTFADASDYGNASTYNASGVGGVRPYFLLR